MIKYNTNTINDWNFGDDNIIKVYKHGAVVYYKFDSEQGGYKVCYAVVDDITQYSDREFEDVYDKTTEKWYKLNNLNQYEQYGIYGSGRTSCEGSASRLPVGYTEVEYVERNSAHNGYLPLGEYFTENTVIQMDFQMTQAKGNAIIGDYGSNDNDDWRVFLNYDVSVNNWLVYDFINSRNYYDTGDWSKRFHLEIGNYYIKDLDTSTYLVNATRKTSFTRPNQMYLFHMEGSQSTNNIDYGYIYSVKIYQNNELVRDFLPCIRNNDSTVGMYDLVNDVFYYPPNNGTLVAGDPVTPTDCVTTYNGKLTIDDGYEYEWNGSSWVNLGEVSGSSKTSDFKIGDIDNPITSDASLITDGMFGIMLPVSLSANTSSAVALMGSSDTNTLSNLSSHTKTEVISENDIIDYAVWKFHGTTTANTFYVENVATKKYFGYSNVSIDYMPLVDESSKVPTVFSAFTKNNVTALGVCKGNTPNQYYAINDLNTRHYQYNWFNPLSQAGDLNNSYVIYKVKGSDAEYPKYYSEKSEPLDNLTFSTMEDAQAYAEANCVYDGMHATIGNDRYYFDSSDENGWVKVTEYYIVEDVTSGGASGWTITGSSTYNPQPSYYDDFSVALNSSYQTKVAKVTIYGYENFTYYLRSTGYSSYAYATSSNVDELTSDPTSMSYSSSSAITNTYNFNKAAGSAVNLSNYRRVTYNNLDKTVEHTFYVVFYDGYYYSSYPPSATILIPKEQTNENWEQVTFSASSNVASAQKSLYIDGNSSTSGGTNFFYHRWIVGLPSGGHSSYTNNSFYDYCPNVTSSTFTSVAGEQRQVNFTYDYVSNKGLTFRLTDGNGNELTPTNTIYYNMVVYNSCGTSETRSNLTFPRYLTVKVGGSFYFSNSSNKHYIYGYQPPTLETMYYADNYQDTFDITYTKLSDEAVTITYTTYDPSDVETPAFKTDITYPYSGGTTSSTTLTSYDVPYTYPYTVSQTSDKFSATSQTYTANQAARTINFVLYPNNREFASVADLEAYAYAWEGMKATVGDTKYKYENGEWVENQHSLPDVPFVLNYNAKQYNASTHSIPMTSGQLNDTDAVAYNNPNNIVDHSADGYITISNSSMRIRKQGQDISLFNRSSNSTSSDLTIVCKAKSTSGENIITNRDSNYNWMYRLKTSGILRFHGVSETGSISWNTSNPDIMSVRTYYDSGTKLYYNNWTQNTSTSPISFTYGSTNSDSSNAGALFVGYSWSNTSEQWSGDFYWVYMSQEVLTDEQIQQVIDYNENL